MLKQITLAFARHESILAFFDLENAYDTTWRHYILQLSFRGMHGNMVVFIKFLLSDCIFRIRFASSTASSFPQFEGVLQGSVLSTTLFLMAVNVLVSALPPRIWPFLVLFLTPCYLGEIISSPLKKKPATAFESYKSSPTYPGDQTAKHSSISPLPYSSPPLTIAFACILLSLPLFSLTLIQYTIAVSA